MTDRVTPLDSDPLDAALEEGRREHRSGRQPLEHRAHIGQRLSAHETASRRRLAAAVRAEIPLASLDADEGPAADVGINAAIAERAAGAALGRRLLRCGLPAVALDDGGRLVESLPDGTSRPVATEPSAHRSVPAD